MPTRVRTPDGGTAVFPDGMSDDQITAVLQREFPSKPSTNAGYFGGMAGRAADAFKTAGHNLMEDARTAYGDGPDRVRGANGQVVAPKLEAVDRIGGDIVNVGLSPVTAAFRSVGNLNQDDSEFLANVAPAFLGAPRAIVGDAGMEAAAGAASRAASAVPRSVAQAFAPVRRAAAPFAAKVSRGAAERQAGEAVASRATNLPAVRATLEPGPQEIVPGSKPTTFQQTGDPGLGSLEREVAVKGQITDPDTGQVSTGPALMAQRAGEQNAARVDALGSVQSGGDPTDVSKYLRDRFDDLDAQHQSAVQVATDAAQAKTAAIGGTATPESHGADLRSTLTDAQQASKARYGALYNAIDPEGKLTANVTATKAAAGDIVKAEPATAAPISGDEAGVFEAAATMPDVAPARDLLALRARVNDVASTEMRTNGSTAVYARLQKLKSAIDDNLANTVSEKVASDAQAVAAGQMAPEQATAARLQADVANFYAGKAEARGSGTGGGGAIAPVGPGGRAAAPGAEIPPTGGPGDAPGGEGLPSDAGSPTFDAGAAERLRTANAAYAQHARTFGVQPVADALRTRGYAGDFRLPDGSVPARFFKPGPGGFSGVQAAVTASPDALPVLEDYAASSLRRAAMRDDGTLDPAKFDRWKAAHQDALRALPPETTQRFADAVTASQAVAEAWESRAAAMKAAGQGAIGRVMGLTEPEDVTRTVGSILGGRTSVADMKALVAQAKADPNATAGLRQAVADHISNTLIGNTDVGASGVAGIKADAYQTFIKRNRPALASVFSPDEMNVLDRIGADIQRANRSASGVKLPGGSNSPQDIYAVGRNAAPKGTRSFLDTLAGAAGFAHGGPISAVIGGLGADMIQGFRAAGIQRVDELVTRAMLDPAVARALLKKVPVRGGAMGAGAVDRNRAQAVLRALQAPAAAVAASTVARTQPTTTADAFRP